MKALERPLGLFIALCAWVGVVVQYAISAGWRERETPKVDAAYLPRLKVGLLVLHEMGNLTLPLAVLDWVIDAYAPGGLLVIDDTHVPGYRRGVLRRMRQRGLASYSTRQFTRSRLRYAQVVRA